MKIIIAGASGFVGTALVPFLVQSGHEVKKLVRKNKDPSSNEIRWDPENGRVKEEDLEGADVFINLAGQSIASWPWTEKNKKAILESRIKATQTLVNAIIRMKKPPQVFINASAVGYYGNRGEAVLTEASSNGTGFLAHVCDEWESAAAPVATRGIRLIYARFGVILGKKGGVLAKMLPPFKLGLGGTLGSGKQYMSWVTIDDVLGVLYHMIKTDSIVGPVNVVSPDPVTNYTFTKTLGKVLSRPTFMSVPEFLIKAGLGEMAEEMLLTSQRASCEKLQKSGYQFCQPELENALSQVLSEK